MMIQLPRRLLLCFIAAVVIGSLALFVVCTALHIQTPSEKPTSFHIKHYRFLHSSRLKTYAKTFYRPTTGAVMLLAALLTCDQVDAYGFMTPNWTSFSDHYYDKKRKPVIFYANHDMQMEMKLWMQLHEAGLINLFTRN
nr:alpha-N-acetylgalactosaminide alpha-2,6-sialyltransferase 2-like [Misgurnus anguillicaudatus]